MINPSVDSVGSKLNTLLTWLLTGVSQQFSHMLLLSKRGHTEMVARLKTVDDTDFPNAMQIIDQQTRKGVPVLIEPHTVAPANSTRAILQTELAFERDFAAFLESLEIRSSAGQQRLAKAQAPRKAYRAWLSKTLESIPVGGGLPSRPQDSQRLISVLLHLMEQTLLHAFANWHTGRTAEASTSWQISGAAMLYLTALVDFCGSDDRKNGGIEVPGATVVDTATRFDADIRLVRASASEARDLAETSDNRSLAQLCLAVAEDCERVAQTSDGEGIRAELGRSGVFRDFRRALRRMNR